MQNKDKIVVARRFTVISVIVVACLAGCSESTSSVKTGNRQVNGPANMIEYLQQQNLPAVESIQLWHNKYGDGLIITTEHYRICTTLLDSLMLRELPGFVESAYRGYNSQLSEPIETTTKFTIYLFARRKQWEDFTKAFAGRHASLFCKIKSGAYYLNGACVVYYIGRERTFSALGHEGWHQFNSRHFKFRLPSWLDEGIAMLFEAHKSRSGFFYFEPGRNMGRLGALNQTLMTNKMIPLKELIAMNPGEVLTTNETGAVMAFYAQSYALVRFLREDGYGKRLGNYQRLLLDGLRGRWPLSEAGKRIAADRNIPLTVRWNRAVGLMLFKQYIGDDFEQLEQEYLAFCRKTVYRVRLKK